jgi:hypothetical protein
LEVALENDKPSAALRANNNLVDFATLNDRYEEAREGVDRGLALARRVGNRRWEQIFLGYIYPLYCVGQWDEALAAMTQLPGEGVEPRLAFNQSYVSFGTTIHVHRGELEEAVALVERFEAFGRSADWQERAEYVCARAWLSLARGDPEGALASALPLLAEEEVGITYAHHALKEVLVVAIQAAIAAGDLDAADDHLSGIDGMTFGRRSQFLEAHRLRLGAQVAAARGAADLVEPSCKAAVGRFRELGLPFWLAVSLLEYGEWLAANGRPDEAATLLDEARSIFEPLKAAPWLERVGEATGKPAELLHS